MWSDNETDNDFLNFSGVAGTVAEIIDQSEGRPISIGVSGAWGVGKSSMIKLIKRTLAERHGEDSSKFVFVEFNAWLYQGYDDARAALMEEIATALEDEAKKRDSGLDKARELLGRVDWLRTAKLAGSAISLGFGIPPVGIIADLAGKAAGTVKAKSESSPPKQIQAIRKCFEEALSDIGVRLVVLIDDLDRCLPPTTISTLEAIRLFMFLDNTAFVIAADDAMIKHAVRQHYEGVDNEVATNYFDKLIQVPIRVPPLGTQEVRAYMMMLFVENSDLDELLKENMRVKVCEQLAQTWRGVRVDRAFMQTLYDNLPGDLIARFDTADRLAPLMTSASQIAGNPRLIKRFLNALSIRMAISRLHGVGVDETALSKMLLFERCGDPVAYATMAKAVNEDAEGKPRFLAEWEDKAQNEEELALERPWDDSFVSEWLTLPPRLSDLDLRGILYVSREHAPLITPEDRLSSEGAEILTAILQHPDMAAHLSERLESLPRPEMTVIMDRLLDRARQEQEWGTPEILDACLAVGAADPAQGLRLAGFLQERPPSQIRPSIVPKIGDQPWADEVFEAWRVTETGRNVKRAITQRGQNGNVSV